MFVFNSNALTVITLTHTHLNIIQCAAGDTTTSCLYVCVKKNVIVCVCGVQSTWRGSWASWRTKQLCWSRECGEDTERDDGLSRIDIISDSTKLQWLCRERWASHTHNQTHFKQFNTHVKYSSRLKLRHEGLWAWNHFTDQITDVENGPS